MLFVVSTLAAGSAGNSKKSMMSSRSLSRIGGGASAGAEPSWKGKTWQSQKAAPNSKKLLQQIGEA